MTQQPPQGFGWVSAKQEQVIMFASVQEYVTKLQGTKVIQKILIANNGIAAVKGIRSIRRWAYENFGNAKAIKFVAMAPLQDIMANAEYVRLADEMIEIPDGPSANNYSNVKLIIDIALKTGCDAVWPGWGHCSEHPELPESLSKTKKVVFIGPRADAMQALGDKISSSIIAETAGVPTLPWSGMGLKCDDPLNISDDLFRKACVTDVQEAIEVGKKVGYPLMVKASEGGGGKGIRKVMTEADLPLAFESVKAEVVGSPIFLMRVAGNSRHLEVQVIADEYGNATALYSRDCSVQRRHQKILEEGPVTVAPRPLVAEMEQSAVRLARSVKYSCAGTVEFLYDGENDKYYFLELNPRLQVEHPVTEGVTMTNIPSIQLNVAMGIPLHRIPDVRRFYGLEPYGDSVIDFEKATPAPPVGHVIAARITAENPEEGFQPTSGSVQELTFRNSPYAWGYFSIRPEGSIHSFSDSQFGHIFAYGATREQARKQLVIALSELFVRGDIRTSAEFLVQLLEHPEYIKNSFNTAWLDGIIAKKPEVKKPNPLLVVTCGAVYTLHRKVAANREKFLWFIERGQSYTEDLLRVHFPFDLIYQNTKYPIVGYISGPNRYTLVLNDSNAECEVKTLRDGGLLVITGDGSSHIVYAKEDATGLKISIDGSICNFTKEFDPSEMRANLSGKVVRFLVPDGTHVAANTPVIALEMMKMIITVNAPHAGTISYRTNEGAVLNQGDIMAKFDLDDKSQIKRATLFEGKFEEYKEDTSFVQLNQSVHHAVRKLQTLLSGYDYPTLAYSSKLTETIKSLMKIADPDFSVYEFIDAIWLLRNKITKELQRTFQLTLHDKFFSEKRVDSQTIMTDFKGMLEQHKSKLKSQEKLREYLDNTAPLFKIIAIFEAGYKKYGLSIISNLVVDYINLEKVFDTAKSQEDLVYILRNKNKDDISKAFDMAFSHARLARKNLVIKALLEKVDVLGVVKDFVPVLDQLSGLVAKPYGDIRLLAKQMLMKSTLPSFQKMQQNMEKMFATALQQTSKEKQLYALKDLIEVSNYSFDILLTFFNHTDPRVRELATEVYVKKAYITFDVSILKHVHTSNYRTLQWKFLNRNQESESELPPSPSLNKKEAIVGSISQNDLSTMGQVQESEDYVGFGVMAVFDSLDAIKTELVSVLEQFGTGSNYPEHSNILQIVLNWNEQTKVLSDNEFIACFNRIFAENRSYLEKFDVNRITVLVALHRQYPFYYTFRAQNNYAEDPIYRHIEPTLAFQLFLRKMSNYTISSFPFKNPSVHVYYAEKKKGLGSSKFDYLNKRFFVRTLVLQGDIFSAENPEEFQISEAERYVVETLNALEIAVSDPAYENTFANHIFLNFLPEVIVNTNMVNEIITKLQNVHAKRLWKLKVQEFELKLNVRFSATDPVIPLRFFATNTTGYNLNIDIYHEVKDQYTGKVKYAGFYGKQSFPLAGQDVNTPYAPLSAVSLKRRIAHNYDTTYVYDFMTLFEQAVRQMWKEYATTKYIDPKLITPKDFFRSRELVLNADETDIVESKDDEIGNNKNGMVAWKLHIKTPESPTGRDLIVIANDITFQSGSFGPKEDLVFKYASELSRKEKIPRFYLAANSGARIGIASEVQDCYQVAWVDNNDPSKGIRYLYLSEQDYEKLSKFNSVKAELIEDEGKKRWKIIDIIGKEDGIGVENLKGSGMIAGETSRAYDEVFTLNYVTSRTVGIGAYLVRLGQRVIQNKKPPILLTGAGALNKVLGREVYSSNSQLGGIQIMHTNGVSHLVANDDLKAINMMLHWLSYVPVKVGAALPVLPPIDSPERDIEYEPQNQQYNPRHMLTGHFEDSQWKSGFFDKDSFMETMDGWAKNIIVGRARLGGIPVGVIAVETKTIEQVIPADPADSTSQEHIVQKAGPVWFPDSAFKTAQAIRDFNAGEELPLFIFANWRGFSGGQRDMFDEILKFGSYIVDALVAYKRPVFVYIPPYSELRGGAWVVVDPTINNDVMEMYADSKSRGGVLEPSGIVEIKYRKEEILNTIHRLDAKYIALSKDLGRKDLSDAEKLEILEQIKLREKQLLPLYLQIAEQFCDLHDTPGRMKAKGVISDVVNWKSARQFFYWRLRRRLAEFDIFAKMAKANPDLKSQEKRNLLLEWVKKNKNGDLIWNNNQKMLQWIMDNEAVIENNLKVLRSQRISNTVLQLCEEDTDTMVGALLNYLTNNCEQSKRNELLSQIRDQLNMNLLVSKKKQ